MANSMVKSCLPEFSDFTGVFFSGKSFMQWAPDRFNIQWWYSVMLIETAYISKLLYSWLFNGPSEHRHTTQTSKLKKKLNGASTMLNNDFKLQNCSFFSETLTFCYEFKNSLTSWLFITSHFKLYRLSFQEPHYVFLFLGGGGANEWNYIKKETSWQVRLNCEHCLFSIDNSSTKMNWEFVYWIWMITENKVNKVKQHKILLQSS